MAREYRAMIGNMMVVSNLPYIVYGDVGGLLGSHEWRHTAEKALARDQAGCRKQGGYSEAHVYEWMHDHWLQLDIDDPAPRSGDAREWDAWRLRSGITGSHH